MNITRKVNAYPDETGDTSILLLKINTTIAQEIFNLEVEQVWEDGYGDEPGAISSPNGSVFPVWQTTDPVTGIQEGLVDYTEGYGRDQLWEYIREKNFPIQIYLAKDNYASVSVFDKNVRDYTTRFFSVMTYDGEGLAVALAFLALHLWREKGQEPNEWDTGWLYSPSKTDTDENVNPIRAYLDPDYLKGLKQDDLSWTLVQ